MSTFQPEQTDTSGWRSIYKIATYSTIIMLLLIPVQIVIFIVSPPPITVEGFFALYEKNWILGLFSLDLVYLLTTALIIPIYLALYGLLKEDRKALLLLALTLGFIGTAAYFPSNPSIEMLSLSQKYTLSDSSAQSTMYITVGQTLLEGYKGTAFNVYYVLNAMTLILISLVMFKSQKVTKLTSCAGLLAGILMIIPSTAGTLGLVLAFLSLIPWTLFAILLIGKFYHLGYIDK